MRIIKGHEITVMTGYEKTSYQQKWFDEHGYTYQLDSKGQLWTTDDWMNGKDKYQPSNDDGFNMDFLNAS